MKLLLLIFISNICYATYPYGPVRNDFNQSGATFEVSNIPIIKSQDGIGLCYGFSTTLLLENLRCREFKLDCSKTSEHISTLDVTSFGSANPRKNIEETGLANRVLKNIQESGEVSFVKEDCAKFSGLLKRINKSSNSAYERYGWDYLTTIWKEYRTDGKQVNPTLAICLANKIKNEMKFLATESNQIANSIQFANNLDNFLLESIIPKECFNKKNMLSIPKFELQSYPTTKDEATEEKMASQIEKVLLNDIPIEISFCVANANGNKCPRGEAHSSTITAIKEVCNPLQDCRTAVKISNSYGLGWQRENNDGWVDLRTLVKSSLSYSEHKSLNWLIPPGKKLTDKKLTRTGNSLDNENIAYEENKTGPLKVPEQFKNFKGIYKCPFEIYRDNYQDGCVPYLKF